MKLSTKITASALSAVALAGLLSGCDKKTGGTAATPTATASNNAPAASDTPAPNASRDDTSEANRGYGPGMSNDISERHRQQMDHDSMRHGPMGSQMGPGGTPAPTESPAAAPMKDM